MEPEPVYTDPAYAELSASEVRENFADVLSHARYTGRVTYVTRNGQRMAAIVPPGVAEELQRREDALDIARTDAVLDRIDAGEEELVPWDKVKAELGL